MTREPAGGVARRVIRAADRVLDAVRPQTGIAVLIHHRVGGGSTSAVDTPAADFERQLELLAECHRVLTLDAGGGGTDDARALARSGVVLTIDDGTADLTDVAVPLLVRHGVPALVYVATDPVESGTPFEWGAPPTSWAALRDAMSTGLLTVGSHTHTPPVDASLRRVLRSQRAGPVDRPHRGPTGRDPASLRLPACRRPLRRGRDRGPPSVRIGSTRRQRREPAWMRRAPSGPDACPTR